MVDVGAKPSRRARRKPAIRPDGRIDEWPPSVNAERRKSDPLETARLAGSWPRSEPAN